MVAKQTFNKSKSNVRRHVKEYKKVCSNVWKVRHDVKKIRHDIKKYAVTSQSKLLQKKVKNIDLIWPAIIIAVDNIWGQWKRNSFLRV